MPLPTRNAGRRRLAVAVCLSCLVLARCAAPAPPAPPTDITAGPKTEAIFLVERGWHTDIGLRAAQLGDTLGRLRTTFPGPDTLVIGFGQRAYLLHREHDLGDMLECVPKKVCVGGPGLGGKSGRALEYLRGGQGAETNQPPKCRPHRPLVWEPATRFVARAPSAISRIANAPALVCFHRGKGLSSFRSYLRRTATPIFASLAGGCRLVG